MSKKRVTKTTVYGAEDGVPLSVELSIISAKIKALGHLIEIQQTEEALSDAGEVNFGIGSLLTELGCQIMGASRKVELQEMGLRKRQRI